MKVFRVAAVLALVAGPVYAQAPHINLLDNATSKTDDEKAADAERERPTRKP
jgi:hypothetical protein